MSEQTREGPIARLNELALKASDNAPEDAFDESFIHAALDAHPLMPEGLLAMFLVLAGEPDPRDTLIAKLRADCLALATRNAEVVEELDRAKVELAEEVSERQIAEGQRDSMVAQLKSADEVNERFRRDVMAVAKTNTILKNNWRATERERDALRDVVELAKAAAESWSGADGHRLQILTAIAKETP